MPDSKFYTLKGYDIRSKNAVSPAMEDYLEMIYRSWQQGDNIRVNALAAKLNVTPPSSSKMVYKLKSLGLVEFEPYGAIYPTDKGRKMGEYLLHRHEILQKFFCMVNGSASELELVERIEHFFSPETVENIEKLLEHQKTIEK